MRKLYKISLLCATMFLSVGLVQHIDALSQSNEVEAAIELKGGRWASSKITYTIVPGTQKTISNAWVKAANEINRYHLVQFVQTRNGQVKLGQKNSLSKHELGYTNAWLIGNNYSRAEAYLSSSQILKDREGSNYAQRQFATALHELGHVAGLKHDSCPDGVMYYASRSNVRTIDAEFLAKLQQLYGHGKPSTTAVAKKVTQAPVANKSFDQVKVQQSGVVRVKYIVGYGVNLWKKFGTLWTGRRLIHGTRWRFFAIVRDHGKNWYKLRNNQWLDGKYLVRI